MAIATIASQQAITASTVSAATAAMIGLLAATLTSVRREHDSLGERDVPNHAYYGVQTVRAVENFPFSGINVRHYEHFLCALACVRKAAAQSNAELGVLDGEIADAIAKACDEISAGKLHDQFVVDMIQGGAGTSTNMCANEVIANRALERLGHAKGEYRSCHPNDAGDNYRFVPARVPLQGSPTFGGGEQAFVNANGSQLSVDVRAPELRERQCSLATSQTRQRRL